MKIPKQIKINGSWWKVVGRERYSGGSFNYDQKQIKVDYKSLEKEQIFLHEIMEILMCEQRVRYRNSADEGYKFFLTHDDFTRYVDNLYAVLKDNKFIK